MFETSNVIDVTHNLYNAIDIKVGHCSSVNDEYVDTNQITDVSINFL